MAAAQGLDDATLLLALRAGDEGVFARVVDEWSPAMLRLARGHVATDASAEEVVQEAWIGVLRGLNAFEGRSRLKTWVFRIVANVAKTRGQREHRMTPFSSVAGGPGEGPTVDPDRFQSDGEPFPGGWRAFPVAWPVLPEGQALSGELHGLLRSAIEELPPVPRAVLTMRDVEGFETSDVCDALGITPGNQRVILHRARASVRSRLESYFTPATSHP